MNQDHYELLTDRLNFCFRHILCASTSKKRRKFCIAIAKQTILKLEKLLVV